MAVEKINVLKAYVNLQEVEKEIETEVWPVLKDLSGLELVRETSGHIVSQQIVFRSLDSGDVNKGIEAYNIMKKIITDFREQIEQLVSFVYDNQFDNVYKGYLENPESKLYDEEFTISIQCTHTDADGLGAVIPMQIMDASKYLMYDNNCTLTVKCPEYISDRYIDMAIALYKEMYKNSAAVPRMLVITDIPMSYILYKKIRDGYKIKWTDKLDFNSDESQAIYIDHHRTNNLYYNGIEKRRDGTFVVSTYGEFEKLVNIHNNVKIPYAVDELKISATYMIYVIMYEELLNITDAISLADITPIMVSISQWDTFEWRDHPECTMEAEMNPILIGTMGFDHPVFLDINRTVKSIWRSTLNESDVEVFDKEYINSTKEALKISLKIADKMWAISALVTSEQMGLDAKELNAPDLWVVVPFPTIGNFSLICQYMMEKDEYKELREFNKVGLLAMDLMDSTLSFRTNESDVEVSTVAKYLGGGGHVQASGTHNDEFAVRLKAYLQEIAASRKVYEHHDNMK